MSPPCTREKTDNFGISDLLVKKSTSYLELRWPNAAAALNALKEIGLEIISEAAEAAVLVVVVHVDIVKGTEAAADVKAVVAFIPRKINMW